MQDHRRAVRGAGDRHRPAESPPGAGDENDASGQQVGGRLIVFHDGCSVAASSRRAHCTPLRTAASRVAG